jgi:hypothetical protein
VTGTTLNANQETNAIVGGTMHYRNAHSLARSATAIAVGVIAGLTLRLDAVHAQSIGAEAAVRLPMVALPLARLTAPAPSRFVDIVMPAPRPAAIRDPNAANAAGRTRPSAFNIFSGDQSVVFSGALGQTIGEVVPIPGTDMIRVGAVEEGTLAQNQTRSAKEASPNGGAGSPTSAVIIFRIERP